MPPRSRARSPEWPRRGGRVQGGERAVRTGRAVILRADFSTARPAAAPAWKPRSPSAGGTTARGAGLFRARCAASALALRGPERTGGRAGGRCRCRLRAREGWVSPVTAAGARLREATV